MKMFGVKNLKDWKEVPISDHLEFEASEKGRNVKFTVNASSNVIVWATTDPDSDNATLLASSDGIFKVSFTTKETVYVYFTSQLSSSVYISSPAHDHRVISRNDIVFTNIETRSTNNTDFDKMMLLMRHNEAQRDRKLSAEMADLREERRILREERKHRNELKKSKEQGDENPSQGGDPAPIQDQDDEPKKGRKGKRKSDPAPTEGEEGTE